MARGNPFHVVTPLAVLIDCGRRFLLARLTAAALAVIVTLANSLIRQANKTQNARGYLDDLLTAKLTVISAQGGVIISTTVNGKSATFQAVAGTTVADFMNAAELALSALERGLTRAPRVTYAVLR